MISEWFHNNNFIITQNIEHNAMEHTDSYKLCTYKTRMH